MNSGGAGWDDPDTGDRTGRDRANLELVRRVVEEVYNGADYDLARDLYADDVVLHFLGAGAEPITLGMGIEGWIEHAREFRRAFPDAEMVVEDVLVDGDLVAIRGTSRGTHRGAYEGFEPTGRTFEVPGTVFYRIGDGRVVEQWNLQNTLGMGQQLGMFPDSPSKVAKLVYGRLKSRFGR